MITGSPELQKDNIIANELMETSALEMGETALSEQFDLFVGMLKQYVGFDEQTYRIYSAASSTAGIDADNATDGLETLSTSFANWFATDNVMISFFAAIAQFGTGEQRKMRVGEALKQLSETLSKSPDASDPLGLANFNKLRSGFIPSKINVGVATRRLLTNGFKEYFREAGEVPLQDCWKLAAE